MFKQVSILVTVGLLITVYMGFFNKMFGKPQNDQQEMKIETYPHQEDWDFYLTNVDDKLSSIAVDLGLRSVAPIKNQSNVMWVSVKMKHPREDGLSSDLEFEKLGQIEDKLLTELQSKFDITFAGRLTSDGHRDFYFYLDKYASYDKFISNAMKSFPEYKYEFGLKEDKEWNGYFNFLFPSPQQFQSIQNRKVIDQLIDNGDKLTKQRPVYHWLYFKTEADRKNFVHEIKEVGFMLDQQNFDKSFGAFPYQLKISRTDNVDQNSVDDYVNQLIELAAKYNGDYDGWETSVEIN